MLGYRIKNMADGKYYRGGQAMFTNNVGKVYSFVHHANQRCSRIQSWSDKFGVGRLGGPFKVIECEILENVR